MVLDADRRAARNENDIGRGAGQGLAHDLVTVAQEHGRTRQAAVAPHQGFEHDGVAVHDLEAVGPGAARQQLVAGDQGYVNLKKKLARNALKP